jgi:hypothetical protein
VIAGGYGKIALLLERLPAERGDQAAGLIRNPAHAADVHKAGAEAAACDLEAASAGDVQSCCPGPTRWYSRPAPGRAAAPAARTPSTGLPACWWPAPPGGPGLQVRAGLLDGSRTYTVRTDGAAWRARTGPGLFAVEGADDTADVTARERPVSGRAALGMEPGALTSRAA